MRKRSPIFDQGGDGVHARCDDRRLWGRAWKLGPAATALVLVVLMLGVYLDRWLHGAGGVRNEEVD